MEGALRESISSVGEKIQEIIDAAERAAREIEAGAEADAARYRKERLREADALVTDRVARLKELSASLSEQADKVRDAVTSLSAELSDAADELRGHRRDASPAESEPSSDTDQRTSPAPHRGPLGLLRGREAPGPVAYRGSGRTREDNGPDATLPEGALLRATQMSVAGHSPEEIEKALRDEFGVTTRP
jgi:hypothetical protein